MKEQRLESVPIAQIRVINPRDRNRHTFNGIVNNIQVVGLKKPITVFKRPVAADGTQYDLVCGQGRLEAVSALGGTHIPAVITDASLKERYLMSLVENIARKRPLHSALVREVQRLRELGCRNNAIGKTLGLGASYVNGIVRLLNCGEARLVEQVVAGGIPLNVAITIVTANSAEVRKALNEAYEKGDLRGRKLVAVQRLIARRAERGKSILPDVLSDLPARNLVKEYEVETQRQRDLLRQAAAVQRQLAFLSSAWKRLLSDKTFRHLLKIEGLDSMPEQLAARVA